MKCSIKRRNLPSAPAPTKPTYVKEVQGLHPKHLEVREAKPAVALNVKKRHRTPTSAIEVSARRRSEAKKQRKEEAIRLYKLGWTVEEIAEHMELHPGSIYDYTREVREIQLRGERYKYDEQIIKMYNRGLTYAEIAEKLGITRENVSAKLQRLRYHGQVGRRNTWVARKR